MMTREAARRTQKQRRAAMLRIYRKAADAFLAANPYCWRHLLAGVLVAATCVHHRAGRWSRLNEQQWWASSCDDCNRFAEEETGRAREEKWLLSFLRPELDDDGRYEHLRAAA